MIHYSWILSLLVICQCWFPCHTSFQLSTNLFAIACSYSWVLAIIAVSCANLTLLIILPPILKSPTSVNASFIKYYPYRLNNMGEMQHPCLTPLPISTLSVSSWLKCSFTLCLMYKLQTNQCSLQLIPIFLSISKL